MTAMNEELTRFFKLLADSSRLKIIGLLARQPCSGEELSAMLGLKASTVSHHLSRMVEAGLVSARAEGYYNMYRLEESALQKIRLQFSTQKMASSVDEVDLQGYDRKVVGDYFRQDGTLKEIPAQRKKREAVLRHVVNSFEFGAHYPEKKVNEILSKFHPDTASLRRELVASGLMARQGGGGEYWRIEV
jgi:biotin operon repressor